MFYYKDKKVLSTTGEDLNIYNTVKLLVQESYLKVVSAALEYRHCLVQNKDYLTKRSERYFPTIFVSNIDDYCQRNRVVIIINLRLMED